MTPQERAQAFFDSVPEFDGTIEEALEAAREDEKCSMAAKWGLSGEHVYGAIARAEALLTDDPAWMTCTRWPRD